MGLDVLESTDDNIEAMAVDVLDLAERRSPKEGNNGPGPNEPSVSELAVAIAFSDYFLCFLVFVDMRGERERETHLKYF